MLRERALRGRDEALAVPFTEFPRRAISPRASPAEVVKTGEIVLGDPDGQGGYRALGRFKLADGTQVSPVFQGLQPPTISIGEQGRDTQPFASSIIYDDLEGGVGVQFQDERRGANRTWWATIDTRRRNQWTLLRRKVDRGLPAGVTAPKRPTAGGVFADRVWVAWGSTVRFWLEGSGWSSGATAGNHTLTADAVPTNNPVEWEGGWFWPLGAAGFDYWNGTAWFHVAGDCMGFVTYAGSLWTVGALGQVRSTSIGATAARTKIAVGTFAAADMADRVYVADRCSGLILFTTADASADVVPHVVGHKQLYQIDPATYGAQPAGPQLPPHQFPMRAVVLGSDNATYLAQGLGVTQWSGDLAQPTGLDLDDGVPAEYRGGITHLANGGLSLFALVDATRANDTSVMGLYGADPTMAGVLWESLGFSYLISREPGGWHVRAVADAPGTGTSMLFISEAENTYRAWFSWNGVCYSLDLEQGFTNPLDDPAAEYEPSGMVWLPIADFAFKEAAKITLMAEFRNRLCSVADGVGVRGAIQYDQGAEWNPLREDDGSHGAFTNARHQYLLAANPAEADPLRRDDPPVGRRNDASQLRFELVRGTDPHRTPVIVFAGQHAIKTTRALVGWQFTVDASRAYNGLSAWQQRNLLVDLLTSNQHGLLHFAFIPAAAEGPAGKPDVRSVKIVRFSGTERDSLGKDFGARLSIMVSEVVNRDVVEA